MWSWAWPVLAGVLLWAGVSLLISAWQGRRDELLAARLARHQPPTVGDEAEEWLQHLDG